MPELVRFGISLENGLLEAFDRLIRDKGYTNRSEAIRDLIREEMVKTEWQSGKDVAGVITLIYDHHKRELLNHLMDVQHDYHQRILSSQHIHLDHHNCLEVLITKGPVEEIQSLFGKLKSLKGVKHGSISMTTMGKELV